MCRQIPGTWLILSNIIIIIIIKYNRYHFAAGYNFSPASFVDIFPNFDKPYTYNLAIFLLVLLYPCIPFPMSGLLFCFYIEELKLWSVLMSLSGIILFSWVLAIMNPNVPWIILSSEKTMVSKKVECFFLGES